MKTILWINPTDRDRRELEVFKQSKAISVIYHSSTAMQTLYKHTVSNPHYADIPDASHEIACLQKILQDIPIDGIISSLDYPGSTYASILAQKNDVPGTPPATNLLCQHKYYARTVHEQVAPSVTPEYEMIPYRDIPYCNISPPCIIRPILSSGSLGMHHIRRKEEFATVSHLPPYAYYKPFATILSQYTPYHIDEPYVLAEAYHTGHQITTDGYVYNGHISMLGIVDSHFYAGTHAFRKFSYPSTLPACVQRRIYDITKTVVCQMGLNNTLFNAEFIYNEEQDTLTLIEINPRINSQCSDLYEKVTNINLYQVAIDIASGIKPFIPTEPGIYNHASSIVLRTAKDGFVTDIPTYAERMRVQEAFPHTKIEIYCAPGKLLSEQRPTQTMHLYSILNIGGNDEQDVEDKYNAIQSMLTFRFI